MLIEVRFSRKTHQVIGFQDLISKMVPAAAAILALLAGIGCSSRPDGIIGVSGVYNYSPSVIESGKIMQFWWCAESPNPAKSSQNSDTIQYESINTVTKATQGPMTVLAETPGAWDEIFTCNPRVIEGIFVNPLGDGQTYTYALYYVGLGNAPTNNIGVAFSNDGIHWNKYPQPVISADSDSGYGVGQPVLFNVDHKSNLRMFYEDSNPVEHHIAATSTDGVHFTVQGPITEVGLDPNYPNPIWGDMAYDPNVGDWYALFNEGLRNPATTGGITERGQFGIGLYRIPDAALMSGSTAWQQLHTFDTNATGFESNFIGAIAHDPYGNVNVGGYPTILIYLSVSYPQPSWNASPLDAAKSGQPPNWAIAPESWAPNNPLLPLSVYQNSKVDEVTTGWVDPSGGFQDLQLLGHLYESPQQGASVALYGCKGGSTSYFVSLDSACEGARILGVNGYAFSKPVAGQNLVAAYRCRDGADYFVSQDPKCGGQTTDEFLGYVPR
jgi:hypothetical protein